MSQEFPPKEKPNGRDLPLQNDRELPPPIPLEELEKNLEQQMGAVSGSSVSHVKNAVVKKEDLQPAPPRYSRIKIAAVTLAGVLITGGVSAAVVALTDKEIRKDESIVTTSIDHDQPETKGTYVAPTRAEDYFPEDPKPQTDIDKITSGQIERIKEEAEAIFEREEVRGLPKGCVLEDFEYVGYGFAKDEEIFGSRSCVFPFYRVRIHDDSGREGTVYDYYWTIGFQCVFTDGTIDETKVEHLFLYLDIPELGNPSGASSIAKLNEELRYFYPNGEYTTR